MSQKIYLIILKSGIYLAFLSPFLVSNKFLFPYITSKQIYFNILMEILFVFWLAFIAKYPAYAKATAGKPSWISIGLISYFAAILISSIASVDFNLSFWGDIERMLGFFHIFHFLIFYFIVITVMRAWKDWQSVFVVSLCAATLISFYSLFKTSYATIGNIAYVGGYLIFNIYFSFILFFKNKDSVYKWLYLLSVLPMLFVLWKIQNSGSLVGLGASAILFLLLYGVLNKNRKIKVAVLSLFALAVFLSAAIFTNKDSNFVKNSDVLHSITSSISFKKVTFQTRLISWKAAWRDFSSHPVLGAGYGNFAITFDKYFDPKFYNFTRSETYFDRAHNNLVDIASTTGALGLLTYLSIFIAVAYYLVNGYRRDLIGLSDFVLLVCLIAAYFIQNLAVFDSLVTYISLMAALGFIHWLYNYSGTEKNPPPPLYQGGNFSNKEINVFLFAGLVMLFVIYQYNIKPVKMLVGTIDGQIAFSQNDISGGIERYKKALSYDTVLDRDSRDSFIRLMTNLSALKAVNAEEADKAVEYVLDLSNKNLKYNPKDSLMLVEHSQFLNIAANFYKEKGDNEKFFYYSGLAEDAINKSVESAPGRIPHYFQKAQVYITRGDFDKAIETLNFAVSLNEDYYESVCKLGKVQVALEKSEGYGNIEKCLDKGGASQLSPSGFVAQLISYYQEKKDNSRVLILYERLAELEPDNAKIWTNLAIIYAQAGNKEKAVAAAQKVGELDPSMKENADNFIKNLER